VEDFDAHPVWVEDEERVIARNVTVLLRREVDLIAALDAARVRRVDFLPLVDLDREVLDPNVNPFAGILTDPVAVAPCRRSADRDVTHKMRTAAGGIPSEASANVCS
jgi:hypothetical protein